jgi:putative peptide zinc metalloprotease protein
VNGAGAQLYFGHLAVFIDSSDLVFASRRQRALNASIGLYIELVLAGAASAAAWAGSGDRAELAVRFASITYLNVLVNLVPFVELDGYWLLTDLLDLPGLRGRSFAALRHRSPRRLLVAFGIASVIGSVVAFAIAWVIWLPLLVALAAPLWNAGPLGASVVVLATALLLFPAIAAVGDRLATVRREARRRAALRRFRSEKHWRIEAAELIATHFGSAVDDVTLGDLAGRVEVRRFAAGEVLLAAGDGCHRWCVVRTGELEVVDGAGRPIGSATRGDTFGDQPLLDRGPSLLTIRGVVAGELFALDAGAYLRDLAPIEEVRAA